MEKEISSVYKEDAKSEGSCELNTQLSFGGEVIPCTVSFKKTDSDRIGLTDKLTHNPCQTITISKGEEIGSEVKPKNCLRQGVATSSKQHIMGSVMATEPTSKPSLSYDEDFAYKIRKRLEDSSFLVKVPKHLKKIIYSAKDTEILKVGFNVEIRGMEVISVEKIDAKWFEKQILDAPSTKKPPKYKLGTAPMKHVFEGTCEFSIAAHSKECYELIDFIGCICGGSPGAFDGAMESIKEHKQALLYGAQLWKPIAQKDWKK